MKPSPIAESIAMPIAWPPRSCDIVSITPCWGYVKDAVYASPVYDMDEENTRIGGAISTLTKEMMVNSLVKYSAK